MTLEGKVAVLVGGGGGIGVASAVAMAEAGATVVVADIDEALAREPLRNACRAPVPSVGARRSTHWTSSRSRACSRT